MSPCRNLPRVGVCLLWLARPALAGTPVFGSPVLESVGYRERLTPKSIELQGSNVGDQAR